MTAAPGALANGRARVLQPQQKYLPIFATLANEPKAPSKSNPGWRVTRVSFETAIVEFPRGRQVLRAHDTAEKDQLIASQKELVRRGIRRHVGFQPPMLASGQ